MWEAAYGHLRLRQLMSWPPAASSPLGMLRLGGGEDMHIPLAAELCVLCLQELTYRSTSLLASSASALLTANASSLLSNLSCRCSRHAHQSYPHEQFPKASRVNSLPVKRRQRKPIDGASLTLWEVCWSTRAVSWLSKSSKTRQDSG